jgi:formylmethanofuran dehydrogenase subunit C
MSALTFTSKASSLANKTVKQLDCRQLIPSALAGLSNKTITSLVLPCASCEPMTVADFFDVSGDDANNIIFKKTNVKLDYIGYGMKDGQITIEGNAGDYLGANMQGGILVCQGNAKDRSADKMRRGILLIDGDVGAYCGSRMIAGTVGIYGNTGSHLGYGLRRGTILLNKPASLSATWLDCGMHTLPFLSLLFTTFKPLKSKFSKLNNTRVQRWMGDASQTGKGEILLFQD